MSATKIALSMPAEIVEQAKKEVRNGRAKSLSAFVSAAVDEKLRRHELTEILDSMDRAHGKPGKSAVAWARRVLGRSS